MTYDSDVPYLQSFQTANRLAKIDRNGVELLSGLRSRLVRGVARARASGQLGTLAGKPAAVYLAGDRLWLAVDGEPWHLDEVSAEIESVDHQIDITIRTPRDQHTDAVDTTAMRDDFTPFAALEDFSFALWIAHIVQDDDRQKVLRETWENASPDVMPEHASLTGGRGNIALHSNHGWHSDVIGHQPPGRH
jgi:hypothetical protein